MDVVSSASPYTASVSVPSGAKTGATKMRVRLTYNSTMAPCGTIAYGETEDYTINITGGGTGGDTQAPTVPSNVTVSSTTSSSISLSWTASADNVGVTSYTVNNATDNVNYTTSGTSFTVTGLTANKSYTFYVNAKDAAGNTSGWSTAAQGTTSGGTTVSYCAAGSAQGSEHISNVSFGTINNSSARDNYRDYTSMSTSVNKGSSYVLTVTIGSVYNGDKATAWFDWNGDGDFLDSGESFSLSVTGSTATSSITVPTNATASNTRMRIRVHYYAANNVSCGTPSNSYGEVEDYTININASAGKSLNQIAGFSAELYPNPATKMLNIRLNGVDNANLQLININGKTVLNLKLGNKVTELDVSNLDKGMYFLKISSSDQVISKKVILK